MNREGRRRVERQIQAIMKTKGDNCSLCGAAFPHNSRTHGGVTKEGTAALVGECCKHALSEAVLTGVFLARGYENLKQETRSSASLSDGQIQEAIEKVRAHVSSVDKLEADILKRGGLAGKQSIVGLTDTPWKSDDASWFRNNQKRSHRLRAPLSGELSSFPGAAQIVLPENHEFQVIVRQVAVGQRVRHLFARDLSTPVPDVEEVIQALFDLVVKQSPGTPIKAKEVGMLAEQYIAGLKLPKA